MLYTLIKEKKSRVFFQDFCKDDIIFTRTYNVRVNIICKKLLSELFVNFEVNMVKLLNLNQFFQ